MRQLYEITFTLFSGEEIKSRVEGVYDDVLSLAQTAFVDGYVIGGLVVNPGKTEKYEIKLISEQT